LIQEGGPQNSFPQAGQVFEIGKAMFSCRPENVYERGRMDIPTLLVRLRVNGVLRTVDDNSGFDRLEVGADPLVSSIRTNDIAEPVGSICRISSEVPKRWIRNTDPSGSLRDNH
jgi:hypothetical protein